MARTSAAAAALAVLTGPGAEEEPAGEDEVPSGDVEPFGVFDPLAQDNGAW
jgi:hypothetical protein